MQQKFYELILNNLKTNGFPEKKVSLPLEKLYEAADKKNVNLNKVLEKIEKEGIKIEKTLDKILFSMQLNDMQKNAMDMLGKMDPTELENIKEKVASMDPTERDALLQKAKEMGMF